MGSSMLRAAGVAAVIVVSMGHAVHAASVVEFDFDVPFLRSGDGPDRLSLYMSFLYGSQVTATDATVDVSPSPVFDKYIYTDRSTGPAGSDLEISFDDLPIQQFGFIGYVFRATLGADFRVRAYNSDYDTGTYSVFGFDVPHSRGAPNPASLVRDFSYEVGGPFATGFVPETTLRFDEPVELLVISNSGVHDVGVDNLRVKAMPTPTAAGAGLALVAGVLAMRRGRRSGAKA